jgi:hypothetical protein
MRSAYQTRLPRVHGSVINCRERSLFLLEQELGGNGKMGNRDGNLEKVEVVFCFEGFLV